MKCSKELIDKIIEEYKNGGSSRKIAATYKISWSTVLNTLRRNNIPIKNRSECQRKYSIDHTFFNKIDSHNKAQILGFIWADGCLAKRSKESRRLQITLKDNDIDYLEWIQKETKNETPLRKASYLGKDGVTRNIACFCTANPKFIDGIERLGIGERKSLIIGFPSIDIVPREFVGSFILGVFDGDGCAYLNKNGKRKTRCIDISIAATTNFNKTLTIILKEYGIDSYLSCPLNMTGKNFCVLRIGTIASAMKFYDLIYSNAKFSMSRKKSIFEEFKLRYDQNLKLKIY